MKAKYKAMPELVDRSGRLTVATTDPTSLTVYISEGLSDEYKTEILLHELGTIRFDVFYMPWIVINVKYVHKYN